MLEINLETVILSAGIMSLISLLVMLFMRNKYLREFETINHFVIYYFLQIIGLSLVLFRLHIPIFFSTVVANTIFVLSILILMRGLLKLYSQKVLERYLIIVIIAYTIIFGILYYLFSANLTGQIVLYLVTNIVVFSTCTFFVYRAGKIDGVKQDLILPICSYYSIYYLLRLLMLFITNEAFVGLFDEKFDYLMVFINSIMRVMLLIGLLMIIGNKFKDNWSEIENKYLHIFSGIRDALILIDRETRMIIEVNDAACILYGYSKNEILKMTDIDLSAEPEKTKNGIDNVPSTVVRSHKKKNGTVFRAELKSSTMVINGRNIILDSVRDISEREGLKKKIEFEQNRAKEYFEVANAIFLVLDKDGYVNNINKKGCEILECDTKKIIGKNWFDNFLPQYNISDVKDVFSKVINKEVENVEFYENSIVTTTGKERYIAWHNSTLKDEDGNLYGVLSTGIDITDRKAAEQALMESEEKFRYIFDNSAVSKSLSTLSDEVHVNKAFCDMLGYTKEEIEGEKWHKITHPDDVEKAHEEVNLLVSGKKNVSNFEKRYIRKDGSIIWAEMHTALRRDSKGDPIYFMTSIIDITDRKNAEYALIESEDKFKYVFDNSSIGKSLTQLNGELQVNNAFCRMTGYTKEELQGETWQNISHPDDIEKANSEVNKILTGQQDSIRFNKRYIKKDGSILWVEIHSTARRDVDGNPQYFISSMIDITDRIKAEKELKESEERYQQLFDEMSTAFALHEIICDDLGRPINYKFLDVNPAFELMTGLKADDIINKTVLDMMPNTEKYWIEIYGSVALTGEPRKFSQYSKELNKHFDVSAYRPAPNQFACTFTDVTNERIAQKELLDSEIKHKAMIANIADVIAILGADGITNYYSENITRYFGWSPEDLIGKDSLYTVHPDDKEWIKADQQDIFKNPSKIKEAEFRFLCKDKSYKYVQLTARNMLNDPIINGILVNFEDITERKILEKEKEQYEEKLRNQQKLESIGTLASGIAHEINNPINGVINYSQLILDSSEEGGDCKQFANEILNESNRVSSIVKNLLQFSRQQDKYSSKASVYDIVDRTLALVRTLIVKDQIQLEANLDDDLPDINCRSQEIQQVIMNLMTNARDALNEKYEGYNDNKRLIISAKKQRIDNKSAVCITVEDFGTGIPKEIHDKILDPFFTTKTRDEGTGLGLSISYGIIKEHGGELKFETIEGEYTKWTILLYSIIK